MKKRDPNSKHLLVILSAIILISDGLLFFRGSNTRVSSVVLLANVLVVAALWRYRLHIFAKSGQNTGSASSAFLLRIVFWIVVAVALFFGFKTFQ
jgi:hypothetical protein